MPSKIIPDKTVEQLVRSGETDGRIVTWLAEHENITVTRQAIVAWRKRQGASMRPMVDRAVPWKLRPEHVSTEPARAIRWYRRRDEALPLSANELERLERVERHLASVGGVLHYDATTPAGWVIAPRREGIDRGIIREP
jgi:hypothetical protein